MIWEAGLPYWGEGANWKIPKWEKCWLWKYSQPKSWELYALFSRNFRTSSPGDSIASNPERTTLRRWREEPGYEVLQQKAGSLLLINKTKYPKLRNLAIFYVWEDAGGLAYWNHSSDMHLSYLGPVFCFQVLSFLSAHHREWLQSDGC